MGLFKRLRKLEERMAIHLRDHTWHERTTPDAGQMQERIEQLEKVVRKLLAHDLTRAAKESEPPPGREDGYA